MLVCDEFVQNYLEASVVTYHWCLKMTMKMPFISSPCLLDSLCKIIRKKEGWPTNKSWVRGYICSGQIQQKHSKLLKKRTCWQWQEQSSPFCFTFLLLRGCCGSNFEKFILQRKCVTGLSWQPIVQRRIGNENHHYHHKVPLTQVSIT